MKSIFTSILLLSLVAVAQAQTIGLELYSLRKQFEKDPVQALALIQRWGITELEGGSTYGMSMEEFKAQLSNHQLHMVAIGADYQELSQDLTPLIEKARAFGARYVVCFWIPHQSPFTFEHARNAVEVFNKAGATLTKAGLTFAYHPHGYEFGAWEKGTLMDYIISGTDKKSVSYEMDVYWVKQAGQSPVAWLERYPDRFSLLHLKDRLKGTADTTNGQADEETNVTLGQGDVDIAAIMKVAGRIGVKHYFIEDESSKVVEQVPLSLEYLRNLPRK